MISPPLAVTIAAAETISVPAAPAGASTGAMATAYSYSTGGSSSSLGHPVQYQFDWGDGTFSGWLTQGNTSASHAWTAAGSYTVRVYARCASDPAMLSPASPPLSVAIQ